MWQQRMLLSFTTGIYEYQSECRRCRMILSHGIRNDKAQRCILTSGTAHYKPENIMRDLQFG